MLEKSLFTSYDFVSQTLHTKCFGRQRSDFVSQCFHLIGDFLVCPYFCPVPQVGDNQEKFLSNHNKKQSSQHLGQE